ncbi:glycoside hydrolase family 3 protein [Legionella saoudiensis]|uniref:glycoside hydrolase family 3 protein n=1 Tax=Legionella saoudiensis TaxID=1750561 RepID=UPI0007305E48|nr:glycoside hydrolase family 3 N-terminal domain-containing protein [Legionella saoudiensis]
MITLRNKIGQMLIMGFAGSEVHDRSPVAEWLSQDGLGGVILFDRDVATGDYGKNLKDPLQIKQLIHQLNHYSAQHYDEDNNRMPLFTAIDYEGGAIDQLTHIEDCMTTMPALSMAHLTEEALEAELSQMAETLSSLGFNLNFAPVVDLHMHDERGIIGAMQRSFSDNPEVVIRLARQFVRIFRRYGVVSCYKHFPGHGSAVGDSHEGFVDVTETFSNAELAPYYELVRDVEQSAMIMTAHVINKNLDAQGLPATLSYSILTELLRNEMGYDGVIISDDLQMQAITDHYSLDEALHLTINAGSDMIIFSNQWDTITAPEVIERIEHLVLTEKIDSHRIEEAYRRIIRLKQSLIY